MLRHDRLVRGGELSDGPGSLWALVVCGSVTLDTAGGSQPLVEGDAVLIGGGTARRLTAIDDSVIVVADLRPAVPPGGLSSPLLIRGFSARHAGVAALITTCPVRGECAQPMFLAGYAALLGAATVTSWRGTESSNHTVDGAVASVMTELMNRPGAAWTLESMARIVHLSRSALVQRFRRAVDASPMWVLREIRMDAARQLLRDPARPVTQVALAVGYGSAAAFSRAFAARHGLAPRAWRAMSPSPSPSHDADRRKT